MKNMNTWLILFSGVLGIQSYPLHETRDAPHIVGGEPLAFFQAPQRIRRRDPGLNYSLSRKSKNQSRSREVRRKLKEILKLRSPANPPQVNSAQVAKKQRLRKPT
ncbi:hypothetical protein DSO57_1007797 [Entomophthora muscae]|uniref:Uncharacterized protein n=1 Tax=Entomophthora muscae TaxID=34485 RepID=A0ACC2RM02_9FUNG|nr:hypothetical protein DSO57_1007797 [Entomophthora muscae]